MHLKSVLSGAFVAALLLASGSAQSASKASHFYGNNKSATQILFTVYHSDGSKDNQTKLAPGERSNFKFGFADCKGYRVKNRTYDLVEMQSKQKIGSGSVKFEILQGECKITESVECVDVSGDSYTVTCGLNKQYGYPVVWIE